MWLVFHKVLRSSQSLNQDDEVKRSRDPASTRYADFLIHRLMDCIFTESAATCSRSGQDFLSAASLARTCPCFQACFPENIYSLFVDQWCAKLQREMERKKERGRKRLTAGAAEEVCRQVHQSKSKTAFRGRGGG